MVDQVEAAYSSEQNLRIAELEVEIASLKFKLKWYEQRFTLAKGIIERVALLKSSLFSPHLQDIIDDSQDYLWGKEGGD